MKRLYSIALAAIAIALVAALGSPFALAQVAQQVTQSTQRLDAATFLQAPAGGATACATVNSSVANNTVTITPPAGQYVYITGVFVDITADTTGTTQVTTLNTTNLTGAPHWSLATIVPTAGANGTFRQIAETYSTPLKSAAPGVAVTFAPSAASLTNTIVCTRVAGYFGS